MANVEQKEIMAKNLNYYLKLNKMTNAQLGKRLNIPESTVNNWTSGQNYPRIDRIQQMADFFGIKKSDLQDATTINENTSLYMMEHLVPVVGKVAADTPNYAVEDIIGYMTVPPNKKVSSDMMYLQVNSDGMDKQFPVNSYVLVDRGVQAENGDVAVVKVNGSEATLKQVKFDYTKNEMFLIPNSNNAEYFPQVVDIDEDEVVLVGKVVGMYVSI